jgi:predicted PurR-regulated permease PerM
MELGRRFDIVVAIIVFLIFVITIYLTKNFISTILMSIVLVYLLKPIYTLVFRLTGNERVSSFSSLMIIFIVIIAVLLSLTSVLLAELSNLQRSGALADIRLSDISGELLLWMKGSLPEPLVIYLNNIGDIPATIGFWIAPIAQAQLSTFVSSLPIMFAKSIVAIFFTYYLLIDGRHIVNRATGLLPKRKRGIARRFLQELDGIYTTLFTVYFTTAIIAGSLAAIGFYLLNIPYPLVWGTLVFIFSLIPIPGPPGVYVPMAIYYFLIKDYQMSIVILVLGFVVLTVIPFNIVAPQLALKTAKIHPILTLLAFVAPIFVLGIIGVVIGPMLYGFLLAIYRTGVYYREI